MSLTGKTLAGSYKDILQVDNSNSGIDTAVRVIKDGEGTASCAYLSDDLLRVIPQNDDTTATLEVRTNSGTSVFKVDTTNQLVAASGNTVNTQYATFSIGYTEATNFVDDTHHPLTFSSANYGATTASIPDFGTGTDPATTFTTSDTNKYRAGDIVPCLWYIPDAISIDSVTSIEGADNATGDTTRMHLKSFTLNSGSTSCLTAGELLAHNTDTTNAGNEQAYKSTWTVDEASVTGGKVILAFMRSDSVNSDYSVNITVKYHLV